MEKIDRWNDTIEVMILKLSNGNIGAMTFLLELLEQFKLNPNFPSTIPLLFSVIDQMKLHGSYLYMLWNDCCDRNTSKSLEIIQRYVDGTITDKDIEERILTVGYGKSFDDLLSK